MRWFLTLAAAAITVASACGSTAPRTHQEATSELESGGLSSADSGSSPASSASDGTADPATAAGVDGASSDRVAGSAPGATAVPAAAGASSSAPTEPGASTSRVPVGRGVRGVTDSAIQVGIWFNNPSSASSSLAAIGTPDDLDASTIYPQKKDLQRLVDEINATGGIAGRKLEPVYLETDATQSNARSGRDQQGQRVCSTFTEDHHVFAFFTYPSAVVRDCILRTKTVGLNDLWGYLPMSESMVAKGYHALWYAPQQMLAERRGRNLVEALWTAGFFKDAKVGLITRDEEAAKDGVKKGILPALARRGIKEEQVTQVLYPEAAEAPWPNIMLQMQRASVTHILLSQDDQGQQATALAMQAADNQKYYPRWGFTSDQGLNGAIFLGAPKSQLANVQGMGWMPYYDNVDPELFHRDQSPTAASCGRLVIDEGVAPGIIFYCDGLFVLQSAFRHATEVSAAGLSAAMGNVAGSYRSMWTIGGATSFSADNHHGPSVYQDFVFDDPNGDCGLGAPCFKYTSAPKALLP